MSWLENAAARRLSGEKWDAILSGQEIDQIKRWVEEASQASSDLTILFLDYLSRHQSTNVRRSVALALGRFRYSDAIQVLLPLLVDRRAEVREAATYSLSHLGTPNVVPLLERMFRDRSKRVRWVAAKALGKEHKLLTTGHVLPVEPDEVESVWGSPGALPATDGFSPRRRLRPGRAEHREEPSSLKPSRVVSREQPPHLHGGYTGMFKGDSCEQGYIDFISCKEEYRYRFSVAISRDEILGADRLTELPAAIGGRPATLAVALLSDDDQHLIVEDSPSVKLLQVPADARGHSSVVHFRVRGLREGQGSLQVLVYHRGCLVIREKTAPIPVRARPGKVVPFEEKSPVVDTMTATIMDHGEDLATMVENVQLDRFASLLIDEDKDEKLLLALFYQDNQHCHFVSARVPAESATVEYDILREKLLELIEMKRGLFGRVFGDNTDLQVKPNERKKALTILREAGRLLWYNLFAHSDAEPVRKQMIDLVSKSSAQGVLQIVSDEVFVPWQLIYVDDGQPEPKAELFWGMRFQIEHTPARGVGLRSWSTSQGDEPIIAFINRTLPSLTLEDHDKIFSYKEYNEDKIIEEFERRHNRRPAFYFYCHAEFDRRPDKCWIKLTDDRRKLTLLRLKRTSFDSAGQLEFDCAPLVFLNACESGQVDSRFYRSFVGFLLEDKKAGGVIGTETKMPAFFATDFAKRFWNIIQKESKPVGQVLYELRKQYWDKYNNPLGLLYSLYANAELGVAV